MNTTTFVTHSGRPLPQLWIGLALVGVCWPLNWLLPGLRTHLLFFPLWLGYALTVDGLVYQRTGTSLLARSWRAYAGLFVISAPAWWLFELINVRTQNWEYVGRGHFTDLEYSLLATLSFSTVMPAVFGTAELASSMRIIRVLPRGLVIEPTRTKTLLMFMSGVAMLVLMLAWPQLFFPVIWLSVFLIVEPINIWRGYRPLTASLQTGDWRPIVSLWLGALTCGFFWEFWNFFAFPQWIYHVPWVDFLRVFEMPILGYGGYLPFGMELFALYQLVIGVFGVNRGDFVHLDPGADDHAFD